AIRHPTVKQAALLEILNEERQLSQRRHRGRGVPLDMDTTGKRIRNCRPLLYLRLLTQRVRDPLAQICSHNRLIGQFGHSAQPLNSRIKDYSYWRPVTAIRTGETDGNPDTTGDPAWTPLRPTPPNQDYASGHSIEGGVGAEVLKQVFGTDGISFQDCGVKLPAGSACGDPAPVLRSYSNFSQAATENALRAFSLDSISGNRSKKERNTVEKSASAPPTISGLCPE